MSIDKTGYQTQQTQIYSAQTRVRICPQPDSMRPQSIGRSEFMARRAVFESGATPRQLFDESSIDQALSFLDCKSSVASQPLAFRPKALSRATESEAGESEGQESASCQTGSKSVRPLLPKRYFEQESLASESEAGH